MCTDLFYAELTLSGGEIKLLPMTCREEDGRVTLSLSKDLIPADLVSLRLVPTLFKASAGDDGYFVLPRSGSGALAYFNEKNDGEERIDASFLTFFGMKAPGGSMLLLMRGMSLGCEFVLSLHGGVYSLYPEIRASFSDIYEDISFELYFLTDDASSYSDMARLVRNRLIALGEIRPLSEKAKERPLLSYMAASPEVRIRMGWKPAPPEILEQTRENEPPMHVACTFDRVGELIDELKAQGVEKAEICLVGWNKSGHDGRWPEMFPVEPLLGGEEGLKRLIKKAEKAGYKLVCHTNSTDCYSISEDFSEEITEKSPDGKPISDARWSGGRLYHLCPFKAKAFAMRDLPKIRALGFEGSHYIDVISTIPPRRCFDKEHPTTRGECAKIWNEILHFAKETFGGISSEGAYGFTAGELDFGLYTTFNITTRLSPLEDAFIPLWQLVYRGIVMSNPSAETVNYPIKSFDGRLRFYEYAGRPAIYVYQSFFTGNHWMGEEDLSLDTDEELRKTAGVIRDMTAEYLEKAPSQEAFLEEHRLLSPGTAYTRYSDGSELVFNYTDAPYVFEGITVPARDFVRIK